RYTIFSPLARAMRWYLIDYARARPTLTLCPSRAWLAGRCMTSPKSSWPRRPIPWMGELAEVEPEWSSIVELRFFLGLTDVEPAQWEERIGHFLLEPLVPRVELDTRSQPNSLFSLRSHAA